MRRINTLLRGVSQKTHVGGVNSTGHAHSSEPTLLHVVDMFGFENSEVTPFTSHYGAIMYWLRMCVCYVMICLAHSPGVAGSDHVTHRSW